MVKINLRFCHNIQKTIYSYKRRISMNANLVPENTYFIMDDYLVKTFYRTKIENGKVNIYVLICVYITQKSYATKLAH